MQVASGLKNAIIQARNVFITSGDTMKRYRIAAWLMIIHGGFMEIGGVLCALPTLIFGADKFNIAQYFSFKLQYFQDNLYMVLLMSALFGVIRIIGAIGVLKNRMWGLVLSVINCSVTMILMMFMLPFGIQDGLLAAGALILLLTQYFGNKKLV